MRILPILSLIAFLSAGPARAVTTAAPLVSVNSGLCMDVAAASKLAGAMVQQWTCNGQANQTWTFKSMGSGHYEIISKNSGLCLDDPAYSASNGTLLDQWTCDGGSNQLWTLVSQGNGAFEIVSVNTGTCVDIAAHSTKLGLQLQLWTCNGGTNQLWVQKGAAPAPAPTPAPTPVPVGGITPSRAAAFQATIGINGHVGSNDPHYVGNPARITADAQYIGATQWRDQLNDGSTQLALFSNLAGAGIQLDLLPIDNPLVVSTLIGELHGIASAIPGGASSIRWIEGPDEPDNFMPTYNGVTNWQGVANFSKDYYAALKSDSVLQGVAVASTTHTFAENPNVGLQFAAVPAGGAGTTAAGGTVFYDTYNSHIYPIVNFAVGMIDPGPDPYLGIHDQLQRSLMDEFNLTVVNKYAGPSLATLSSSPRIVTEFAWSTSDIQDPTKRAIAHANAYLNGFVEGWSALFGYELYLDGDGWGFLNSDSSPTPTGTLMHNLTTVLHDPSVNAATFATAPLGVTVTNLPSDAEWFLLQKASGHYQVVLWRNTTNYNINTHQSVQIPPQNITVSFSGNLQSINTYSPLIGTSPQQTLAQSNSVTIALADDPQIIDVQP